MEGGTACVFGVGIGGAGVGVVLNPDLVPREKHIQDDVDELPVQICGIDMDSADPVQVPEK